MRGRFLMRLRSEDGGFAMISVIATMLVMSLLVVAALTAATNAVGSSRRDQDFHAALAAAEAGVDDYLYHLNVDPTYYNKANTDPANPALSTTTWQAVPGAANDGKYQYQLLSNPAVVQQSGSLKLKSTGQVRGVKRTVHVTLAKASFLDYLYYTQYETRDPNLYADPATATATCAKHRWEGRPESSTGYCVPISFSSQDGVNGPVHSEDSILINGSPTFGGTVDTGWNDPAKKFWVDSSPTLDSAPSFQPGSPRYESVTFPETTAVDELDKRAAGGAGCIYTGPTRIVFNSGGTMTVTSPFTTRPSAACGTFTGPTYQATVPVPDGKVVSVRGVTVDCTVPANQTAFAAVGFPIAGDNSMTGVTSKLGYGCSQGDIFVEGWVSGRVTLSAANNIVVTNDLRYVGAGGSAVGTAVPQLTQDTSGSDVLGLVARNFIEVYRPIACTTRDTANLCTAGTEVVAGVYPKRNIQIDAAIVASSDSFLVQNWRVGNTAPTPYTLTVVGGIAQNFRGAVSTNNGATGYVKNYHYDTRLKYNAPPYLADLARTSWGLRAFAEGRP